MTDKKYFSRSKNQYTFAKQGVSKQNEILGWAYLDKKPDMLGFPANSKLCVKPMPEYLWWNRGTFAKPLICVYCGVKTMGDEDLEHIIPESLGSKDTLYPGAVCKKCNNRLGVNVESKMFKEPLMASGQVATGAEGKRGKRNQIGKHVSKSKDGVAIQGGISGKDNEFQMSRTIAKAGVNILTHYFGSSFTRDKYPELINYVLQPKSKQDIWPYAAIFTPTGGFGNSYGFDTITSQDVKHPIFLFMCASGVFASSPNRSVENGAELTLKLITDCVDNAVKNHGAEIVRMSYVS